MNLHLGLVVSANDSLLGIVRRVTSRHYSIASPHNPSKAMTTLTKAKFALVICLALTEATAVASGTGTAFLQVSTYISPSPPAVIVQTLNANKEIMATYEMHPSTALEKAHEISLMEESKEKADDRTVRIISVTFY